MREEDLWGLLVSVIIIWYARIYVKCKVKVCPLSRWVRRDIRTRRASAKEQLNTSCTPPRSLLSPILLRDSSTWRSQWKEEPVYKLIEVVRLVKKTWPYSILKYSSFVVSIKIRCLKRIDRKGELKRLRRIFWQMDWFLVPFVAKCTRLYVDLRSTRNIVML